MTAFWFNFDNNEYSFLICKNYDKAHAWSKIFGEMMVDLYSQLIIDLIGFLLNKISQDHLHKIEEARPDLKKKLY